MKTYLNINLPFERKLIIQKDRGGSIFIGFYKKDPIPGIGRKALEELDNKLSNDREMVRALIDSLLYRYPKDDLITKVAVEDMYQAVATTPATDISEPMKPIRLSKEERQRINEVLKKTNQVLIDLKGDEHEVTKQMYGI